MIGVNGHVPKGSSNTPKHQANPFVWIRPTQRSNALGDIGRQVVVYFWQIAAVREVIDEASFWKGIVINDANIRPVGPFLVADANRR